MNKKGGIGDLFVAMILAFILIVIAVGFSYAANLTHAKLIEVAPRLQETMNIGSANVTDIINNTEGRVSSSYATLKWITVMLIFGFFMSVLVASILVRTHPIAFVAYIFVWILAVIISVYISNTYEILYNDPTLGATFVGFFQASWIFLHFPIWVTVFGAMAAIFIYANLYKGDLGGFQ